jgi:serine/threonine protein phosphatase PrpC
MLRAEVELAWKTQAGHRHQVEGLPNEDAVFTSTDHPLLDAVLIVADGMGGHPLPAEASRAAVEAARDVVMDPMRLGLDADVSTALISAVLAAHRAVRSLHASKSGKQPGTTLSIVALADGQYYIAHVGDGSVFLMRDGQVLAMAGGEAKRLGNRPQQFLGQDAHLEPETRRLKAAEGDRLLVCTDGLTRYFNEVGPEALAAVLGRRGVRMQTVASQLVAHSRPDSYDDDTTVALLEVASLSSTAGRRPPAAPTRDGTNSMSSTLQPGSRRGGVVPQLLAGALGGAILLGTGLAGGYLLAARPTPPVEIHEGQPASGSPEPALPEELQRLPSGNLILVDPLGGRVYALATRPNPPAGEPLDLRAFRVGTDGRLAEAGRFRLNPERQELTDSEGHRYPVEWDASRSTLQVVRGGTLVVNTKPAGARVIVDGRPVGVSPVKVTVAAGKRRVRVEGSKWSSESEIGVPAGRSVSVTLSPQ